MQSPATLRRQNLDRSNPGYSPFHPLFPEHRGHGNCCRTQTGAEHRRMGFSRSPSTFQFRTHPRTAATTHSTPIFHCFIFILCGWLDTLHPGRPTPGPAGRDTPRTGGGLQPIRRWIGTGVDFKTSVGGHVLKGTLDQIASALLKKACSGRASTARCFSSESARPAHAQGHRHRFVHPPQPNWYPCTIQQIFIQPRWKMPSGWLANFMARLAASYRRTRVGEYPDPGDPLHLLHRTGTSTESVHIASRFLTANRLCPSITSSSKVRASSYFSPPKAEDASPNRPGFGSTWTPSACPAPNKSSTPR